LHGKAFTDINKLVIFLKLMSEKVSLGIKFNPTQVTLLCDTSATADTVCEIVSELQLPATGIELEVKVIVLDPQKVSEILDMLVLKKLLTKKARKSFVVGLAMFFA
jgi:hypothetical protein